MVIALIIAIIALQIGQWLYSKKCIDTLKLTAQEWRETAEAYRDEIADNNLQLQMDDKAKAFYANATESHTKTKTDVHNSN